MPTTNLTSKPNLIRDVLIDRRYLWVRILVAIPLLGSFLNLYKSSISYSCQLSLLGNFLIPFLSASMILSEIKPVSYISRIKTGVASAIIIGTIIGLFDTLISNIHYYFLGGAETAAFARGHPILPLTIDSIIVGLASQFVILLFLIMLSMFSGFMAGILQFQKRS